MQADWGERLLEKVSDLVWMCLPCGWGAEQGWGRICVEQAISAFHAKLVPDYP